MRILLVLATNWVARDAGSKNLRFCQAVEPERGAVLREAMWMRQSAIRILSEGDISRFRGRKRGLGVVNRRSWPIMGVALD